MKPPQRAVGLKWVEKVRVSRRAPLTILHEPPKTANLTDEVGESVTPAPGLLGQEMNVLFHTPLCGASPSQLGRARLHWKFGSHSRGSPSLNV